MKPVDKGKLPQAAVIGTGYWNKGYDNNGDENVVAEEGTDKGTDATGRVIGDEVMTEEAQKRKDRATHEPAGESADKEEHANNGNVIFNVVEDSKDDNTTDCQENEGSDAPDGGWGWVVTLACFVIMNMIPIMELSFGVLFSGFLSEMGASSTTVAWIFTLISTSSILAATVVGPLVAEFGWRKVAFTAGLVYASGIGLSAFATSPWFLIFSCSIMGGLGKNVLIVLSYLIIPHYFTRRRGLANGMMTAGSCSCQILAPPLITYLQEKYGFRGAILIMSAIMLNCCAAAMVFQPVEWHRKTRNKNTTQQAKTGDSEASAEKSAVLPALRRMTKMALDNIRLLKSIRVIILALISVVNIVAFKNISMMVPSAIQDAGYTLEEASWGMSLSGVCNLVSRLVVTPLVGHLHLSMRGCYMSGSAILALGVIIMSWVESLTWKVVSLCLCGCGAGVFLSLYNLVMVEYLGLEKLSSMLSITVFFSGIWILLYGPLIGLVRDLTGSYPMSLTCMAATVFLTVILWLFMPAAVAFDQRREAELQKHQQRQQRLQQQQQQQQ